jgi:hypothetical protein
MNILCMLAMKWSKLYNLIRFWHYKQVLEAIEDMIVLIHECVSIMDWRGIIHDW